MKRTQNYYLLMILGALSCLAFTNSRGAHFLIDDDNNYQHDRSMPLKDRFIHAIKNNDYEGINKLLTYYDHLPVTAIQIQEQLTSTDVNDIIKVAHNQAKLVNSFSNKTAAFSCLSTAYGVTTMAYHYFVNTPENTQSSSQSTKLAANYALLVGFIGLGQSYLWTKNAWDIYHKITKDLPGIAVRMRQTYNANTLSALIYATDEE